jgi:glycine cleavage system aminomethyltransferase T
VFSVHGGRPVAINFGSAAGELAVCSRKVGLTDSSHLSKLVIAAPAERLRGLIERLAGSSVSPGGVLFAHGALWCGVTEDRVLVLCGPALGARIRARLATDAARRVTLSITDHTTDWGAIELLGPGTRNVLRALGTYGTSGDPRQVAPFTAGSVAGIETMWVLPSDRRAIALVPYDRAGEAWRAIEEAGRPFGLSCVGRDAANRYALLERSRAGLALADR